jgi:hypothetical protein
MLIYFAYFYAATNCDKLSGPGFYFDKKQREHTVDRLAQRIERLGYEVHLELRQATV